MRNFKKRTIALVLASALTVAGSFAAEKYKNSVMALDFEAGTNGAVTMIVQTKNPYNSNINLVRKDAETYILTLPEFNSNAPTPDLTKTGNILSVTVNSRPYTTSNNGYTRIVVKTNGRASLFAQSKLFISKNQEPALTDNKKNEATDVATTVPQDYNRVQTDMQRINERKQLTNKNSKSINRENVSAQERKESNTRTNRNVENSQVPDSINDNTASTVQIPEEEPDNSISIWSFLMLFCALVFSAYMLILGKNKMSEVVGKSMSIDINDDNAEQKKKNVQKSVPPVNNKAVVNPKIKRSIVKERHTEQVVVEKMNVIDMDELFNVQKNEISQAEPETNENAALEDFLSSYYTEEPEQEAAKDNSVKEEEFVEEEENEEEKYNKILHNDELKFSQKDVDNLKNILYSELTEEVLNRPRTNIVTKPVQRQKKAFALENLILDYYIKQSVAFTHEDIDIVRKLMNVELDNDFITDLRTNIKKTPETEVVVEEKQTVSVNQGTTTEKLTNVIEEAKEMFSSKSSTEYGATVLKLDFDLPDLQDALAHPEKYEDEQIEEEVDEDSLLKSLSNVQFKPFYTEEAPVNNEQEEYELEDNQETLTDNLVSKQEEILNDILADNSTSSQEMITEVPSDSLQIAQPAVVPETISSKENKIIETTPAQTIIIEDTTYSVKSVAKFNENAGCYLAQTDKYYAVLGFIGDKIIKLKEYDTLKSEKISVRINETFANGTERYLVKTGLKKFVADFDGNNITYVMDLC